MSDLRLSPGLLLNLLILAVCTSHLLYLAQLDYVVYDHGDKHTAKPALEGYYQLKDAKISSFITGMFGHHQGYPRYPALVGYLTALVCYFFGLSEVLMRALPLLFYPILIYYTYQCAKEIDSQSSGALSVLILIIMPAIVFYSRLAFPAFLGIALMMGGAFYHLLKANYFLNIYHSLLFGAFSG